MDTESFEPGAVLAALAGYPVLPLEGVRAAVVGGFVRDVWLGREPRELDLVIEGDVAALAQALGAGGRSRRRVDFASGVASLA